MGDLCLSRYIPALGLVSPTRTILYVPTLSVACRVSAHTSNIFNFNRVASYLGGSGFILLPGWTPLLIVIVVVVPVQLYYSYSCSTVSTPVHVPM